LEKEAYSLYSTDKANDLKELLINCVSKQGEKPAFIYQNRKREHVKIAYNRFKDDVDAFGTYLHQKGIKNCNVAVFGENSYEWILTYFAVTCGGNVIVPIDKDLPADEVKNLVEHSSCTVIIYSETYTDIIDKLIADNLLRINMNDISKHIESGRRALKNGISDFIDFCVEGKRLASIVYTSGTMGLSKGVMLTHENLAANTVATCQNVYISNGTVLLLPLHHTFGLVAGVLCVLLHGHYVYINKSLKNINQDLMIAKPEHLSLVPLFVEGFYKRIWENAEKQGKAKVLKHLIRFSNFTLLFGIDLRSVLFKSIVNAFGGNLKLIISGGSGIDEKYIQGFKNFGITVINGYGITECAPVVATNRNKALKSGTVGFPLSCNRIRIDKPNENGNGEILVNGENVMLGYYKNPEATAEAFDGEWFKTGDLGYLDKDGFLYITGRKKNLIILDNGKNVYPEEIEGYLAAIKQIKEVVVYAKNKLITAEIFPDTEIGNAEQIIREKIALLNKTLPMYKQVQSIIFRQIEFEKTTTQKIKRHKVGVNNNV